MSSVRHLLEVKGYDVWSIDPDASVHEALRLMNSKDVGALLVMKEERLVGIVSERDCARRVALQDKSPRQTRVGEIMTEKVYTVHPLQTVQEAMMLMNQHHIRHLPVVADDKVIGVISIGDVLRDIIYQQRSKIKVYDGQAVNRIIVE